MSESAADGDVHEEQTERGVCEFCRREAIVELSSQEQGTDRHGGWLGDERAEEGPESEDREPPGSDGMTAESSEESHDGLCEDEDGTTRGNGHDDQDEEWFGEMEVAEVVDCAFPTMEEGHADHEWEDPKPEDDFDLTEEVEHFGFERHFVTRSGGFRDVGSFAAAEKVFAVFVLEFVRELHEARGEKGVDDRESKDGGAEIIESGIFRAESSRHCSTLGGRGKDRHRQRGKN